MSGAIGQIAATSAGAGRTQTHRRPNRGSTNRQRDALGLRLPPYRADRSSHGQDHSETANCAAALP